MFWNEAAATVAANNHLYWTRHIDPVETLKQLDERFSMSASFALPDKRMGLLRCASQICELYMIPANPNPCSPRECTPGCKFFSHSATS